MAWDALRIAVSVTLAVCGTGLAACGGGQARTESAPEPRRPPVRWTAEPPAFGTDSCAPVALCTGGSRVQLHWPGGEPPPFDAETVVDGEARDVRDLWLGDCVGPGRHVVEVRTVLIDETSRVTDRRGTIEVEVAPDGVSHLDIAAGGDDSALAFTSRFEPSGTAGTDSTCTLWSPPGPGEAVLAPLSIESRPFPVDLARRVRVRLAVDEVEVLDMNTGEDPDAAVEEARAVWGLVTPGEHMIHAEVTWGPRWMTPYGYDYLFSVRHDRPMRVPAAGARLRVRSGHRGSITTPLDQALFVETSADVR